MMQLPPEAGGQSHWLVYFGSAEVDSDVERVAGYGGGALVAPMDVPGGGRIAVISDPQGAIFALFAGRFDP